ncbi:MAG TPA: NAD(+)/NADH kinase [Bryobacteraceae bacterium]|nr:NAD(+)/NADH kinase [Bryobacteraceae bacterium]
MPRISRVAIVSKPGVPRATTLVPELIKWLADHRIAVRFDKPTAEYLNSEEGFERTDTPDDCELVLVLGGDGTLLSAARAVGGRDIPIFAVNLGGLGFLTAITVDELYPELERALRGEHRIAHRRMLHCELWRGAHRQAEYEALNDVVITKSSLARMIDVEIHVASHFVAKYRADGLIVATPTGSTAYSLSAGGPIVFPGVSALCITPICPHMLTYRPVLVPDDMEIRIMSRAVNDTAYLTIDGQVGEPLDRDDTVVCRRSEKAVALIRPPRMMFFDVLREKLSWGER